RPLIFYGTRDVTQRGKTVGTEHFTLLDTLKEDDRNVIMEVRSPRSSEGAGTEVVRMDTLTGRRTSLGRAPKENCSIALGKTKEPLFTVCSSSRDEQGEYDERTELYRMQDGKWVLVSASKSDGKHLWIERVSTDGTVYATRSAETSPGAIGTLDTQTGEFRSLFQDRVAEVQDMIWSSDEATLIGVITAAGAPKVTLIDENHPDA